MIGRAFACAMIIGMGCSLSLRTAASADRVPTIEEVLQTWRLQHERVKTLRATIRHRRTLAKYFDDPRGTKGKPVGPPQEKTFELTGTFWIDGDRWRADDIGPGWHLPTFRMVETHYIHLFDGERALTLSDLKERGDQQFPVATFRPPNAKDLGSLGTGPTTLPWLLNYRNEHPIYAIIQAVDWKTDPMLAVIDGHKCFAIVARQTSGPSFRFWVCPDFDFRILRRELDAPDLQARDEMKYKPHAELGWVLDAWSFTVHRPSLEGKMTLMESEQYNVEQLSINETFPEDPFDYQVPEGTWVNDFTGDAKTSKYIARANGEKRQILQQELARGAQYSDILKTQTGEAGRPMRDDDSNWWFWGSAAVFLIAFGIYIQRCRRE